MEPVAAFRLARQLLANHGLDGWQVGLDKAKRRAGCCHYSRKMISLSLPLVRIHPEAEVRETILHEIAHALVGPKHGHDEVWRRCALSIGSSGARCVSEEAPSLDGKVVGVCPVGHSVTRHKRPSRVKSCLRCSPDFDPRYLFTWTWCGSSVRMLPQYVADLVRLSAAGRSPLASEQLELDALLGGGAGDPRVQALLATPYRPGSRVVLAQSAGSYAGLRGVVLARGRSRYKVQCDNLILRVPAVMLRADGNG